MRRLVAALSAAALSAALLGTLPAGAAEKNAGPKLPEQASDIARAHAEDVLAQARTALSAKSPTRARQLTQSGGVDASMALNQLMRVRDALDPAGRRAADALLARPGPTPDSFGVVYPSGTERAICGTTICMHWTTSGSHAPSLYDGADADTWPDYVQSALATAESVNTKFVSSGYRRPRPDGTIGGTAGGRSDLVDIYLGDVGNAGVYGYCTSDENRSGAPYDRWGYCVIDNDFAATQFPTNTPKKNQQVTLAHEYFHAIQYAYDAYEDPWLMESTATWAEDELFDSVDDNLQYLRYGQLGSPKTALDTWKSGGLTQYGNWIFFRYLTEKFRARTGSMPNLVLRVWKKADGAAGGPDQVSLEAVVNTVQKDFKAPWRTTYLNFATANRRPGKSYSEGGKYRAAAPAKSLALAARRSTSWSAPVTRHLSSYTIRVKPGRGTSGTAWKLRLNLDLGDSPTGSVAKAVAHLKSGKVSSKTARLNGRGQGNVVMPFNRNKVKYVELTIANTSLRTTCWRDNVGPIFYTCYGTPTDDAVKQKWKATAFR